MEPALLLSGVGARVSPSFAIAEVGIDLPAGKVLALVGPSGSGKSTLLRIISGLGPCDEGTIIVRGRNVTLSDPGTRGMRLVFQSPQLFPYLNVRANLQFPARSQAREGGLLFEEVSELLDLSHLLNRSPRGLSGGETQRVALGRALLSDASLLLLDEPLSNVDPLYSASIWNAMRELLTRGERSTVYVTHNQYEATGVADLISVVNSGRIEQTGSVDELLERPRTEFVAKFLGHPGMAIFPGVLVRDSNAACLQSESLQLNLRLPSQAVSDLPDGTRISIGLRRARLAIGERRSDHRTCMTARLERIERSFDTEIAVLERDNQRWRLPLKSSAQNWKVGTDVAVDFAGERCFLFGPAKTALGAFVSGAASGR